MVTKKNVLLAGLAFALVFGSATNGFCSDESTKLSTKDILNQCDAMVFCKDAEGRYIEVNDRFYLRVGKDVLGKKDNDIYSDKAFVKKINETDQQILSTGKPVLNLQEATQDISGQSVYLVTNKYPMKNREGRVIGVFGIAAFVDSSSSVKLNRK